MMRNFEFYAFGNKHPLLRSYALRGVLDDRRSYSPDALLMAQHRVYVAWREYIKKRLPGHCPFDCSFYEWMLREADAAFVVKPGDLVKCSGSYCLVEGWGNPTWCDAWRVVDGKAQQVDWPQPMNRLTLVLPNGNTMCCNANDSDLEPAGLPPEVFALACGRAKDCPMMKGGAE